LHKLIEPDGNYAGGWVVMEQPWVKGDVLLHGGSNGTWYALVVVARQLDRAFVVATNSCSFDSTPGICNDVLKKLVGLDLNAAGE